MLTVFEPMGAGGLESEFSFAFLVSVSWSSSFSFTRFADSLTMGGPIAMDKHYRSWDNAFIFMWINHLDYFLDFYLILFKIEKLMVLG